MAATSSFARQSGLRGYWQTLVKVVRSDPVQLTKHVDELKYLIDELNNVKEKEVKEDAWLEFSESCNALLNLRSTVQDECALSILEAIVADEDTMIGLGAAATLKDAIITTGKPPIELLLLLKQGPSKHIKTHAYAYRRKIDLVRR